jgi:radical SAM superfamily enzyme YgiQ (UPF0313 family)
VTSQGTIYLVAHQQPKGYAPVLPYGIMYVGHALQEAGYTVRLFDLRGDQDQPLLEAIRETRPLFVGFSNYLSSQLIYSIRLSEKVHALGVPVVWGGIYSTVSPELALAEDYVDYIVQGEGERTAPLLAEALQNGVLPEGISGVGFKRNGEQVIAPRQPLDLDLDHFRPAWDLLPLEAYTSPLPGSEGRWLGFFVSRGCPFRCAFCYNQSDPDRSKQRSHSPEYCREELGYLKKRLGLIQVALLGDHPFAQVRKGQEIVTAIEELGLGWHSVMRVETIGEEFAYWLKRSKVVTLGIGVESGSERILKMIQKGFNPDQALQCFQRLNSTQFAVGSSWIFFFPNETEQDRRESYALMDKIRRSHPRTQPAVNFFRPNPRTPLFQYCIEQGWKPPSSTLEWAACVAEPSYAPFSNWSKARRARFAWVVPTLYQSRANDFGPLIKWLMRQRVREGSFRLPLEDLPVAWFRWRGRSH